MRTLYNAFKKIVFVHIVILQITHDDIQKTYGGGSTRSYFSGAYSSTNAYMLMYRQIDPIRNTLPMQVQDFPKHIQVRKSSIMQNVIFISCFCNIAYTIPL